MAVNKVELSDGTVLVDLSSDTVTPETLALGVTAHNASGEEIVGTMNVLEQVYPVGAVFVSTNSTNPATSLGFGTWKLVDKMFKSQEAFSIDDLVEINTTNCTSTSLTASLSGHTVYLNGSIANAVAITDNTLNMFTIDPETVGISAFPEVYQFLGFSDSKNGIILYRLDDGAVSTRDIMVRGSSEASFAAGSGRPFSVAIPVPYTNMLDSFCDKFFWKRTA